MMHPQQHPQNYQYDRTNSQEWNPHRVIPPIGVNGDPNTQGVNNPNPLQDLMKQLPRDSYLPRVPVKYPKHAELHLRRLVHQELRNFDVKVLKDLYMELSGFDRHLTGLIDLEKLSHSLQKHRVSFVCPIISKGNGEGIGFYSLVPYSAAIQNDLKIDLQHTFNE